MFEEFAKDGNWLRADDGSKIALVKTSKELITRLVSMDTRNRKKKKINLALLHKIFEQQGYKFNAQAICVSDKGFILNGGHRLKELQETGAEVEILLAWDMPADRWGTFDNGEKRSVKCYLSILERDRGLVHTLDNTRSCMNFLLALETGDIKNKRKGLSKRGYTLDDQMQEFHRVEKEIERGLTFMKPYKGTAKKPSILNKGSLPLWGALYALFARVNEKKAKEFFSAMRLIGDHGHPAALLMQKVNNLELEDTRDDFIVIAEAAQDAFNFYNKVWS